MKAHKGDFIFDIKILDYPNFNVIEKRKMGADMKEWKEFLEKFGIDFVEDDKSKTRKRRTPNTGTGIFNSQSKDSFL